MTATSLRLLLAALATLLASCAGMRTDDGVAIEILDCGVVDPIGRTGRIAAPGTGEGYVSELDRLSIPRFTQACPAVEIGTGDRMGIVVRVLGDVREPWVAATTRVTHPAIVNPRDGAARVQDEWQWQMDTRYPRYTGWSFDHPWEVVEGTWKFEVLHAGRIIGERTLQVRARKS